MGVGALAIGGAYLSPGADPLSSRHNRRRLNVT